MRRRDLLRRCRGRRRGDGAGREVQDGRRRAAAGDDEDQGASQIASLCLAPQYVAEDLLRAEGFTDVQYVPHGPRACIRRSPPARPTSRATSPRPHHSARPGDADRRPGRDPRRLLRAVRHRARPHDPRPEREDRRRARLGYSPAHFSFQHGGLSSAWIPGEDITWVTHPSDESMRLLGRGQDRRVHRLPAGAAGASREEDRPRRRQQRRGPALVPVLLLHAGRQPGVRPEVPGGHEARAPRDPQGHRHLCARSRSGPRARLWSTGVSRASYDYALQTMKDLPYAQVARVRPRGHAALLRPAPARGRDDQVEPAEAHRPGHRLAVPQRAEEGAEGMITGATLLRGVGEQRRCSASRPGRPPGRAAARDDEGPSVHSFPAYVSRLNTWRRSSCEPKGSRTSSISTSRKAPSASTSAWDRQPSTSPSGTVCHSYKRSRRAGPSSSWPGSTSAVPSCSRRNESARFETSKGRPSRWRSEAPRSRSCQRCLRTSASITARTLPSWTILLSTRFDSSRTARSTLSWRLPRGDRSFERGKSAT